MVITFDDEEIIQPESWSEDSEVVETVDETEAGTDQISVVRYDKLSISCSFNCSHRWAKNSRSTAKKMKSMLASTIF